MILRDAREKSKSVANDNISYKELAFCSNSLEGEET